MSSANDIIVSNVHGEDGYLLDKNYKKTSFKRFNGYLLRYKFEEYADRISKIKVRDTDIWVCSYPKTGTTWTQQMVWCIANNFDLTSAEKTLTDRYIFLDKCFLSAFDHPNEHGTSSELTEITNLLAGISADEAPRFIKTHLPFDFLPEALKNGSTNAKIVYITRNPRDTCISSYHFQKYTEKYVGTKEDFCEMFMRGIVSYGPYFKNVFSYWNNRNDRNLLFLKYEDMKKDLPSVIRQTATFLGKTAPITDECMNSICEHLSFNSMKKNTLIDTPSEVYTKESFFRKGEADQWKEDFEKQLIYRFENWEKENLKNVDYVI